VQSQLSSKGQALDAANGTIIAMKARIGTLESKLESEEVRDKQPTRDLENTKILQKDAEDKLVNQV
jgi:hypothetical protein